MSRISHRASMEGLVVASIVLILRLGFFVGRVVAGGYSMSRSSPALNGAQNGSAGE